MEQEYSKKKVLFLCLVVMALLMLPDIIFSFFNESFHVSRDPKAVLFLAPLAFGLVTSPKCFIALVLIFFSILQIFQFAHLAYFGINLTTFALQAATKELPDVINEIHHLWLHYLYIPLIVIVPFYIIYRIGKNFSYRRPWVGMISILAICGYFGVSLHNNQRYLPNSRRITLDNSLRVFFGCIDKENSNYVFKEYKPYSIVKNNHFQSQEPVNIVFIVGESCNYRHMSLFGYDIHDTTPRLKNLAQNPNFYHTVGISAASATSASFTMSINVVREPDNLKQLTLEATNLFNLAKQSGFETFYLSTQSDAILSGSSNFIDHISTKELAPLQVYPQKDLYLLELIKNQNYKQKNFIVLHQFSIHSPYEWTYGKNYKPEIVFSGQENPLLDQYDNAMLYNDWLISEMFNFFNKSEKPFYIIWASDHNELLGENGLWGHGSGVMLIPEVSQIPVLVQTNDSEFLDRVKNTFAITHYEIAKLLAQRIGFDIINPNEADEPDVFYTNGHNYCGKYGYIRFKKDISNRKVDYDPPHYP